MVNPEATDVPVERRRAIIILEVLAGIRSSSDAARELGIAQQAYYNLEERAVKGLVQACVPRPPGPRRDYKRDLELLERERDRLLSENARYQALVRASQLSVGVDPDQPKPKKKRQRPPTVRALRAIDQIESKAKPK